MTMSKESRKLTLNRETLTSLQSNELDGVQGGTSPAISTVSIASMRFCSAVSAFTVQQAQHSFTGVKKAIDTAKRVINWTFRPPVIRHLSR
jgi:hypothetical protein